MTHWHIVQRAGRWGGRERLYPEVYSSAEAAMRARNTRQARSNLAGSQDSYGIHSCNVLDCWRER